mmetsp:Transcript_86276/g.157896  ORF Transcript_86276/g.157896 Transcript_86276/m.157896 type:complete len:270 (+) Transcript_86276:2-811(+)
MLDLMPFFFVSQRYGIVYQEAALKDCVTLEGRFHYYHCDNKKDVALFKKRAANGTVDKGVYASTTAKLEFAALNGCPKQCIVSCNDAGAFQPIMTGSRSTCISGECSSCTKLFGDYHVKSAPKVTSLAKDVVKSGLPAGQGGVRGYPDTDGSPRIGRPTQQPGDSPFPTVTPPSWDFEKNNSAPTPATPTPTPATPAPTPAPTPATPAPTTPAPTRRRRRRGSTRRRRRRSSRRRSSRRRSTRRRKSKKPATSLVSLLQEVEEIIEQQA